MLHLDSNLTIYWSGTRRSCSHSHIECCNDRHASASHPSSSDVNELGVQLPSHNHALPVTAGVSLSGILAVLFGCLDMKAVLAGKHHYVLYALATALKPRMLLTVDEEGKILPVPCRYGDSSIHACLQPTHLAAMYQKMPFSSWQPTSIHVWVLASYMPAPMLMLLFS